MTHEIKTNNHTLSGADFSEDRKYRFSLWRIWNQELPLMMVIGLNPSTANETDNDNTIQSVCRIAKYNGYAWGNFKVVKELNCDKELYCKAETQLIKFIN